MINIMVVDDDPILLDFFDAAQSNYGYRVVASATSGEEALLKYSRIIPRPDIVIMDQRMPGMCGVECTKRILQMDPHAKIVFVSAEHDAKKEAISAGAVEFVEKPFALSVLMEILMRVKEGIAPAG